MRARRTANRRAKETAAGATTEMPRVAERWPQPTHALPRVPWASHHPGHVAFSPTATSAAPSHFLPVCCRHCGVHPTCECDCAIPSGPQEALPLRLERHSTRSADQVFGAAVFAHPVRVSLALRRWPPWVSRSRSRRVTRRGCPHAVRRHRWTRSPGRPVDDAQCGSPFGLARLGASAACQLHGEPSSVFQMRR
jgi:hypothetical protein